MGLLEPWSSLIDGLEAVMGSAFSQLLAFSSSGVLSTKQAVAFTLCKYLEVANNTSFQFVLKAVFSAEL